MNLIPSGLTDYSAVNDYQHALHDQVARGEAEDTLIVGEFSPAWTAGRHTKPQDIPDSTLPVIHVDRAGSATWHGPGQVVIYPIVRLRQPVDLYAWIRSVENGVLETLREEWGLPVERIEGRAGVWLRGDQGRDRKICAIGLKVARGATMHGIALNVDIDPQHAFSGIIPCGLTDADVASLSWEGISSNVAQAAQLLVPHMIASITPQLHSAPEPLHWESAAIGAFAPAASAMENSEGSNQ